MSVWSMLAECVGQLDEPFRRSEIIGWFRRHYPQVNESTLAAHIQAATANAGNRAQNHPYLARRAPLLRRVDHGLYVRAANPDVATDGFSKGSGDPGTGLGGGWSFAGEPSVVVRHTWTRGHDRARRNVEALIEGFDGHVRYFEAGNAFSGPSVYFHNRAIERRRTHTNVTDLLADERFLEYVYAVLPSWGMHRMGSQRAKVGDFGELVASLRAAAPVLEELWPLHITRLAPGSVQAVSQKVWQVIAGIRASTSGTQLVAGSKTLHHILPDLLPPIDRQYTFRFFTGQTAVRFGDQRAFLDWFPDLTEIAERSRDAIDTTLGRGGFMATGPAKVIDNAIIGFMRAKDAQPGNA
jgi:hypothetical protein